MNTRSSRKRIENPVPEEKISEHGKKTKTKPVDNNIGKVLSIPNLKLSKSFFAKTSYELAKALLGKLLVHDFDGNLLKCRIVETELYPGGDDKGSVSFNGRRTLAIEPLYMDPGTTYVYLTYGMYHCINISSTDPGGAVLIRAAEPDLGTEKMTELRMSKLKTAKSLKLLELCNGPSKLCIAMGIDKVSCNALDISTSNKLWVEDDKYKIKEESIVSAKRIGIDRAGSEAVNQLYRFYLLGNNHVSKRDIEREKTENL